MLHLYLGRPSINQLLSYYNTLLLLRFFSINDPFRFAMLFLLVVGGSIPILQYSAGTTILELKGMVLGEVLRGNFLYTQIIDDTPPLMALVERGLSILFDRSIWARHILALLLIFLQATYFGYFLVNKITRKGSIYIPALLYVCVCYLAFGVISFSAELLGSTFLLLALYYLISEVECLTGQKTFAVHIGMCLGISTLFVFVHWVFLIASVLVMVFLYRRSLQNILLLIVGFSLVHAVLWMVYFWMDGTVELWANFYKVNLVTGGSNLITMNLMLRLGAIPFLYLAFSFFYLILVKKASKKYSYIYQIYFFWLIFGVIVVLLSPNRTLHSFFPLIPFLIYFINRYFFSMKRRWLAEILVLVFVVAMSFVKFKNHWSRTDVYAGLFPLPIEDTSINNKKIMVLGDYLSMYIKNKPAGFFINWRLSKPYFMEPDYYENIVTINESFLQDPPEVIFDPLNIMSPVMERIPRLKIDYKKVGDTYWRR